MFTIPKRKSDSEFKREVYSLVGDDYKVLTPYKASQQKVEIKHVLCGNTFSMVPQAFLVGQRCPACMRISSGKHRRKTNEEFLKECSSRLDWKDYYVIDKYKSVNEKLKFYHITCSNYFMMSPHHFITDNTGCPFCYGTPKKKRKTYQEQLKALYNNQYILLENYTGGDNKLLHQHLKCGTKWYTRPHNLLRGYGCPYCSQSKGEYQVEKVLKENNIGYVTQKTFRDLKDLNYLSYDFYLEEYNILIEYQGIQHYEPIEFFGGKSQYTNQLYHDSLKEKYALNKGYRLITIPYKVKDLSSIKKYLNFI